MQAFQLLLEVLTEMFQGEYSLGNKEGYFTIFFDKTLTQKDNFYELKCLKVRKIN